MWGHHIIAETIPAVLMNTITINRYMFLTVAVVTAKNQ